MCTPTYIYIYIYIYTHICAQSLSHVQLFQPIDCSPPSSDSVWGVSQARIPERIVYTHTHTYIKDWKEILQIFIFFWVIFVPVFQFCIRSMYHVFFFNVTFKITEMSKCYLSLTGFSFAWVTTGASQLPLCPHSLPLDSQPSLYCLQGCLLWLQAD